MNTTNTDATINIDVAACKIAARSMATDTFNVRAAITAQLTEWFGTTRGTKYNEVQARLMDRVSHNISEAMWRVDVVAGMEVQE